MAVNDELFDRIVHSRTGLIRFEHKTVREIERIFRQVEREIRGYLLDLPEYLWPQYAPQRKFEILRALNEAYGIGSAESIRTIRGAMEEAARREGRGLYFGFQKEIPNEIQRLGVNVLPIPEDQLIALLDQEVLGDFTQTLIGYHGKFNQDTAALVDRALGASIAYGEDVGQISARLRGITGRQGLAMSMFSRTAIQTAGYRAQQLFYKTNEDIIKKEEYMATFDIRTCPICAGYDGRKYNVGEGPPIPIHVGCRCTYAPITKSWKELGFDMPDLEPGTRASMDGGIPETVSLEDWLRKKANDPKHRARLEKNWGKGRVKLFAQGKVDLNALASRRRGHERIVSVGDLLANIKKRAS